jgi:hypothetical protein
MSRRPGRALLRVLGAPAFVLTLWILQMVFAKLLAGPARAAAETAMRQRFWFDDGHRLRAVVELVADDPAILAAMASALTTSAILAAVFSIVAAPAILLRLDSKRSLAELLSAVGSWLPAMLTQTGYGLVFRAILTGLAAIPAAWLGPKAAPLVLLIASFPIAVLDRARTAVVLDGERRYHPRTFLRAIVHVGRRPLWWLGAAVIEAAKLGIGVAALLLVIQADFAGGSLWLARVAGLLAVIFGLWRVALAVEDRA